MKVFGVTDRGSVRKENQDTFRFNLNERETVLTAVLCDGMGGAQAGSTASKMAADAFMSHAANSLDETSTVSDMKSIATDAINYANIKVYDKSFSDFACMGMGSTLVSLLVSGKNAIVANVGDSRAYMITKGRIQQVSHDHSLVEELVEKGKISREEAANHPKKNIITRAIGIEAAVKCDIYDVKLTQGARFILCSDGLSNVLSPNDILSMSEKNSQPEDACNVMLTAALRRGATDNVTILVAQN